MKMPRRFGLGMFPVVLPLVVIFATGCAISVNKGKDGEEKNVKIDTPLGGIHVNTDATNAADFGLPVYPGAQLATGKDGDKPADVHVGFGDWQFRLKVVKYHSPDSADSILAFYKKALGRYGDVIQCSSQNAVGSPAITREGLTCDDSQNHHEVNMDLTQSLKAGSKHRQHIVGIEKNAGPGTDFSLVQIDLPAAIDGEKPQTN